MTHDESPPPRTNSGTFSDRSLSQDSMELMDESEGPYRSSDSSRRNNRSFHHRNYESDYDDQRFSSSSSGRYRPEYRSDRERHPHHTAPALENRRRMFEREQGGRRWEAEYSDSYSDVEFKRHHYANDMPRDRVRERERERERVTEYRRFFQQQSQRPDEFRPIKPSMKRQDSSTSESSFNRHYPEGLFEMYRSRFEVNLFFFFVKPSL